MILKDKEDFGSLGLAEFGMILHVEWIKSKVLPYSTGDYIQYPVINYNGIYI